MIVLSFGRCLTLREIGVTVGLSESGVCRVRARALRRLRSALNEKIRLATRGARITASNASV